MNRPYRLPGCKLRDLIEMEMANFVEFMPRLPFTKEELAAFEARVERTQ